MGVVMELVRIDWIVSEGMKLALTTGFLGGLTTFSAFSAEAVSSLSSQEYFVSIFLVLGHVVGSILMTFGGIFAVKFCIPSIWQS